MRRLPWAVCVPIALLACAPAAATGPVGPGRDHARIDAAAVATHGRLAVNQAAGTGNVQANLAALAVASPQGLGLSGVDARQTAASGDATRDLSAAITAGAFGSTRGLLSINQAAGSGNAQANLLSIAQGNGLSDVAPAGLDDTVLAAVTGAPLAPASTLDPSGLRHVEIADAAFQGSQGVVQVNQTAGVGNQSSNAVVLQLPGGAPP